MLLTTLAAEVLLPLVAMTQALSFSTVAEGQQSAIEERREAVVRTAVEWTSLWNKHAPGERVPMVDFTKNMVVGVFGGLRSTGGHVIRITSVEEQGDSIVVTWRETKPPPDAMVTQVLTYPFHLVRIPRSDAQVKFQEAPPGR